MIRLRANIPAIVNADCIGNNGVARYAAIDSYCSSRLSTCFYRVAV